MENLRTVCQHTDNYSVFDRVNFMEPIQMQLSNNRKIFGQNFLGIFEM